jgi:hypothetical protein
VPDPVAADPSEERVAEQDELLDAVRSLSEEVGSLQTELQALRAQSRALPIPGVDAPGWEERAPTPLQSPAWVRSLDSPSLRGPAIPRLLVEIVFLIAVAIVCAIARLETPAIVGVMALAWGLVALTEWLAARRAREREELAYASLRHGTIYAEDPSWFGPPLERGELDAAGEQPETAAKLPPPSSG